MSAITGICAIHFETMADFLRHLPKCVRCTLAASVSLMEKPRVTTPSTHYHASDPTVAFSGESCDRCPTYAGDFIAKTQAQSDHFLVPAPADYLACDRTINEERRRLRAEYLSYPVDQLIRVMRENGRQVSEMYGRSRAELINEVVDTLCPRGWLDRRLKEVL